MMTIKLLAALFLAGSVGVSAGNNQATPGIKKAAPASYDLRVGWFYNASVGYNQLWAYTSSGGGLTQQVYWTQEPTFWRTFVDGGSFFAAEFNWHLRIPRSTANDALFSVVSGSVYRYNSPDNNISFYRANIDDILSLYVSVNDSDYYVKYMRSINANYNGLLWYGSSNEFFYSAGAGTRVFAHNRADLSSYAYFATYGVSSFLQCDPGVNLNQLSTYTTDFYFQLAASSNIEGDDWWDIYNKGVNNGYDNGLIDGYNNGLDAGRLENTAWDDAFTIIKGAVDTVGDVMGIQLFGPVTIGTLVSIPLIVGLLFWIIDKWRGS